MKKLLPVLTICLLFQFSFSQNRQGQILNDQNGRSQQHTSGSRSQTNTRNVLQNSLRNFTRISNQFSSAARTWQRHYQGFGRQRPVNDIERAQVIGRLQIVRPYEPTDIYSYLGGWICIQSFRNREVWSFRDVYVGITPNGDNDSRDEELHSIESEFVDTVIARNLRTGGGDPRAENERFNRIEGRNIAETAQLLDYYFTNFVPEGSQIAVRLYGFHGSPGAVEGLVSLEDFESNTLPDGMQTLFSILNEHQNKILYVMLPACNIGRGVAGRTFLNEFSRRSGSVPVVAFDQITNSNFSNGSMTAFTRPTNIITQVYRETCNSSDNGGKRGLTTSAKNKFLTNAQTQVFNLSGQLVKSISKDKSENFNINYLPTGIYIIKNPTIDWNLMPDKIHVR